jgi:hypothetical protein
VYAYCSGLDRLSTFTRLINVSNSDATVAQLSDPAFVGTVFLPVDDVSMYHVSGEALLPMMRWSCTEMLLPLQPATGCLVPHQASEMLTWR